MIFRLLPRISRLPVRGSWRRFSDSPIETLVKQNPSEIKPFLNSSLSPVPNSNPNSKSFPSILVAGAIISTAAAAAYISKNNSHPSSVYHDLEQTLDKSKSSFSKLFNHMSQTALAASILWKSLASLMTSANHEMRSGFEFRVAGFLADISAASGARRMAIVGAGGGAVVDWLLESVGTTGKDRSGTREEAARALAYLIADPCVCGQVLGRPGAVPSLLRFIFSFQPKKKQQRYGSLENPGLYKGRSMLVAALMDIITSNCDIVDISSFQPLLPPNANMRDIAIALEVIEEGGIHLDEQNEEDGEDGDRGMKGIGIKVVGGTTILGFSRADNHLESESTNLKSKAYVNNRYGSLQEKNYGFQEHRTNSNTVPGLWDDLQREHVAVPFAAWALANWALASEINRSHIQDLDRDGRAVMSALMAPERTVKWHGSLVARALLDDQDMPLTVSVSKWCSSLLSTGFHASKVGDISLAQVALSAFVVSVERSDDAKKVVMDRGLQYMREIAKQAERHVNVQESLARVLELLYDGDMHLSIEEAKRWSGIFLRWIFGGSSSDNLRALATKILAFILEDHGPGAIPISQGWLAICLDEIIEASKVTSSKGNTPLKLDKVKTQIDQSNILSATQVANQLASSVIKLASKQVDSENDSLDNFPLADLLSFEPFLAPLKTLKKNSKIPKIDAAESALATVKSVKALSELCSEDITCQQKLVEYGILCLLKRLLMNDDYENLAAIETYEASTDDKSSPESSDPSSVRVPPTALIRRHAARLLRILSLLPEVKKYIKADENWCKWLEDCANGLAPCCSDLKTRSNARATLLNIQCSQSTKCAQYEDTIFLINPDLPHWKCSNKSDNISTDTSETVSQSPLLDKSPLLDIIFIHGLRGGPYKSWRIADDKSSTTSRSGLVENIDQDSGMEGTCWPGEWLSTDFPYARLFTVKYKTNLTQWSGASLPLQEVSSMLLHKLVAAGIGNRPVVFITHSMGGLVVKQMLFQAKMSNLGNFVNNTVGVVFYSCPHFGSKLADMPWRMGMVFRPAPSIGELRSGSPRLVELNDFIRRLHIKGYLEVLSFSETQVTPIVEGYGGWAFRMEIVPIESAYPGFGELVVLDGTDHINSCKPVDRTDPSYSETLEFLKKLKARLKT